MHSHPRGHLRRCTNVHHVMQLHSLFIKSALDREPDALAGLIHLCAVSLVGLIDYARSIFDHSHGRSSLFAWNALFRGYSRNRLSPSSLVFSSSTKCIQLFNQFRRSGVLPDNFTFPFVLKACSSSLMLGVGKQIHSVVLKMGFARDLHVLNTLVGMYGACGSIEEARKVFDEIPETDTVSWSSIMAAYVHRGLYADALLAFCDMKFASVMPNSITYVSLLSACSGLDSLRLGESVHNQIIVNGIGLDAPLGTALLNMYASCGKVNSAFQVFNGLVVKNLATWTAMISASAKHGRAEETVALFSRMQLENFEPDSMAFTIILSACSHLGLVGEGRRLFDNMRDTFNIEPTMEHYGCMVDMLGRAGMLDEAYEFMMKMPFKPNSVILRSFVGSCRSHSRFVGVDEGMMKLLEVDPDLGANYVLAANIAALSGRWDNTTKYRRIMKEKKLKKTAGCSLVKL
ncbi:pentatricopeptide repeat-containing protein At2g36730-like [Nymphaea colorata]|nr:pentatricopeptide repeat-containing protein At2g36730-like [Nymphaea colorata]